MTVCILTHSLFGNADRCAARLEEALQQLGAHVTRQSIKETNPKHLPEAELYVLACPTRFGGPTWKMKRFVKRIEMRREHVKFAILTTCMFTGAATIEKLATLGIEQGLVHLPANLEIKIAKVRGPLEDRWQEKVDAFGKELNG